MRLNLLSICPSFLHLPPSVPCAHIQGPQRPSRGRVPSPEHLPHTGIPSRTLGDVYAPSSVTIHRVTAASCLAAHGGGGSTPLFSGHSCSSAPIHSFIHSCPPTPSEKSAGVFVRSPALHCAGGIEYRSRYPQLLGGAYWKDGGGKGRKRKVRKRRGREGKRRRRRRGEEEGGGAGGAERGSRTALAPSRGADVARISVLFLTPCCVWKVINFSTS